MKNLAPETKTFASLALFTKMGNNNENLLEVIGNLVVSSVLKVNADSFNIEDVTDWIYRDYGFILPEGVCKIVLSKCDEIERISDKSKRYKLKSIVDFQRLKDYSETISMLEATYSGIQTDLFSFIESHVGASLTDTNKEQVLHSLYNHILYEGSQDEYTQWVLKFIMYKESEPNFKDKLNCLLEGLLLYIGLSTEPKEKNLNNFNKELILVLDSEILFHIIGYHNKTFQKKAQQFTNLVEEVNTNRYKEKGKRIIKLRYLEETQDEINNIFENAISVKRRNNVAVDYTEVLSYLTRKFTSPTEIAFEQNQFWYRLKKLGILPIDSIPEVSDKYNLVKEDDYLAIRDSTCLQDNGIGDKYICGNNGVHRDIEVTDVNIDVVKYNLISNEDFKNTKYSRIAPDYYHLLKINRIYALRKGNLHNNKLEDARYVLVSDTGVVIKKSIQLCIKGDVKGYRLATSMTHITCELWLKLNKAFHPEERLISFDIIAKTRCALAAIAGESLRIQYKDIIEKYHLGVLTKEMAEQRLAIVRTMAITADDFKGEVDADKYLNDKSVDEWLAEIQNNNELNETTINNLKNKIDEITYVKNEELKSVKSENDRIIREKDLKIAQLEAQNILQRKKDYNKYVDDTKDKYKIDLENWEILKNKKVRRRKNKEWIFTITWMVMVIAGIIAVVISSIKGNQITISIGTIFIITGGLFLYFLKVKNESKIKHSLLYITSPKYRKNSILKYESEFELKYARPKLELIEFNSYKAS